MLTPEVPKVQPHDHEAEQAILGAILIEPTALARAQELLEPADFYDSRHQRIFRAMGELAGKSEPLDLVTLGNTLESSGDLAGVGGRSALAEILAAVASASNITQHCRIVADHAKRRKLIRCAADMSRQAYEKAPIAEILREAERSLLQTNRSERSWCSLAELTSETATYVDHVHKQGKALIGIPSGYAAVDSLLGGWQRSDLIIIAARPSMGKTAFALGTALAAAQAGYHVGVLSLEMSRLQVGLRLHGMGAPLDVYALRTGSLSMQGWRLFASTAQKMEALPFWVDDSAVLTAEQVSAKARYLKAANGLDLLIVDYLQLLQLSDSETRQQGIADASRKLKLLAKELDIPVLVLSQLSRECEKRPDPRPMLSDLRDSGAIEQDADVVLFLYREEVYVRNTEEKGVAEVLIRKHRNGPIGDRKLQFRDRYAQFVELEHHDN